MIQSGTALSKFGVFIVTNVAAIQNDCHFVDDILKFASSFENSFVFLWALFPVVQLMICQD